MDRPPSLSLVTGYATVMPLPRHVLVRSPRAPLRKQNCGRVATMCEASAGSFERPKDSNNSDGGLDKGSYTAGYESYITFCRNKTAGNFFRRIIDGVFYFMQSLVHDGRSG